jgi:hypothetical protein
MARHSTCVRFKSPALRKARPARRRSGGLRQLGAFQHDIPTAPDHGRQEHRRHGQSRGGRTSGHDLRKTAAGHSPPRRPAHHQRIHRQPIPRRRNVSGLKSYDAQQCKRVSFTGVPLPEILATVNDAGLVGVVVSHSLTSALPREPPSVYLRREVLGWTVFKLNVMYKRRLQFIGRRSGSKRNARSRGITR